MTSRSTPIFKDPNVAKHLSLLHVIVSNDKTLNNIILFCMQIKLHRLLDKEPRYCQFTWQPYIYPDDTYEIGNPGQS